MIKEKYIDLVKSRVDISQLVVDLCPGTALKPAGSHRRKCRCVFHEEKTPSLMFDTTTNRYKCFGCGKGSDVISFMEDFNGLDFTEAVRALLDMYCPNVDSRDLYVNGTPEKDESSHAAETMYIYNRYAYEFFRAEYEADNPEAAACRAYAERHGEGSGNGRWDAWFYEMFGLGSPLRGNRFLAYARGKGLKTEILLALGLIGEDEAHPGNYYDFYRGRLMIPQRDRFGRIQAFTARSLQPHATVKYLNGKDCLIYRKSTAVFGIDVTLKAARQTGKVYLVEGAPDVMHLQSIDIANVVASLGGHGQGNSWGSSASSAAPFASSPMRTRPKEADVSEPVKSSFSGTAAWRRKWDFRYP